MILFDLMCERQHGFEGWFPDTKAYARQVSKGVLACPACGSTKVEKALMAPAIATSRKADAARASESAKAMRAALGEMRRKVEDNCDYVGAKFAEEARQIHYGEVEKRDIYGEATAEEAKELNEEGVEFGLLPWADQAEN